MWTVALHWTEETFQSGEAGFSLLFRNSGLGSPPHLPYPSVMTAGKLPQGSGEGGHLGVFPGPGDTTNHIKTTLPWVSPLENLAGRQPLSALV